MTKKKKDVKKKVEVVFDSEKRKEFLTGFRKRKNERRKHAKDKLEEAIKNERKRIRKEIKEGMKTLKKTYEPLRELTEEDMVDEYEDADVQVKIVELTTGEMAAQRNMLGENRGEESDDDDDDNRMASDDSDPEDNINSIPGMDLSVTTKKSKRKREHLSDEEEASGQTKPPAKKKMKNDTEIKSKKELDRLTKKKTLNKMKKSKVFKKKEQVDKKANQKKTRRDKNNSFKSLPKHQRLKKKFEPSRYRKGRMMNRKQFRQMKQQS